MAQNVNILQELNELNSSLAGLAPVEIYQVPAGYFEGFAAKMIDRIKALEATNAVDEMDHLSPLLNHASKEMPYEVPAGYFEGLDERLLPVMRGQKELSAKEELESISPLLSSVDKKMPFEVPAGYFDTVSIPVQRPAGKVVSMGARKWMRYAAAAMVAGVIFATTLIVINLNKIDPSRDSHTWVKKSLKKVSTDKLVEFVTLADEDPLLQKSVASTEKSIEVQDLLKEVPQSEIESFLQETEILSETDGDDAMMN